MSDSNGGAAEEKMLERISTRFPSVSSSRIEEIVREEHERLSGGRIRDYVPVLVERATTERLRGEAGHRPAPQP